jgi:hypothetical protein
MLDWDNVSHYEGLELPKTFKIVKVSTGTRIGDIFNNIFRYYPNEEYYGIMADDVMPETFRWDILLREACLPDKIVWGWDGGHDESLPRHPFIGGDLVRRLGFLSVPGVKHWYVDNGWQDIALGLGCGMYLPEIRMTHQHHTTGRAQNDRTYTQQPDPQADEITYKKWKKENLPLLLERLRSEDAA